MSSISTEPELDSKNEGPLPPRHFFLFGFFFSAFHPTDRQVRIQRKRGRSRDRKRPTVEERRLYCKGGKNDKRQRREDTKRQRETNGWQKPHTQFTSKDPWVDEAKKKNVNTKQSLSNHLIQSVNDCMCVWVNEGREEENDGEEKEDVRVGLCSFQVPFLHVSFFRVSPRLPTDGTTAKRRLRLSFLSFVLFYHACKETKKDTHKKIHGQV